MAQQAASATSKIRINPVPLFELSPYRFMQFMEPLGTTDASVEAAWDFQRNCWREDVVAITRELAPGLIRWPGGILTSYYRWKEAVGPREKRRPMHNLLWGGMETNQVGTHEFIDFCRQVGAAPLIAVNFEADGIRRWAQPEQGGPRAAGPREAAAWVDYCNNPQNSSRRMNGAEEPFNVRLWQIGNETSYNADGFDARTAARRTKAFARAMHAADPTIELIAWGDSGQTGSDWAGQMLDAAGEEIRYLAFHHHFQSGLEDSPLRGTAYRKDKGETWRHLMNAWKSTEARIQAMRRMVAGTRVKLALTESHFALPGRNRCDVLASWGAGAAYARILNTHARHGDLLKIATLADFCGTRWTTNAVMIPTPRGSAAAYMMPVARVMALFRRHSGNRALDVTGAPAVLDVTASLGEGKVYLHVVNTEWLETAPAVLEIEGYSILGGQVHQICADPLDEADAENAERMRPVTLPMPDSGRWSFPAASVSVVELDVEGRD